jgi:hypothetical protein
MKSILLTLMIAISLGANSQRRDIPFFGKVALSDLCGSDDCRPSHGTKAYINKKDKLFFDGNYNTILGKTFRKNDIFNMTASSMRDITDNDVNRFLEVTGSGTLDVNQKKSFDASLSADLKQLLKDKISLPEDLKVDLLAELENSVKKETQTKIDYGFEIIELKKSGDIDRELTRVISTLVKGDKIVTGISVVTVSGSWTSNTIRHALDSFEAKVGLKDKLSAEAKLEYERTKTQILQGNFKKFSFIIGDSFKIKA